MQAIELLMRTLCLSAVSTFEFYPFKKQTNVFAAFEEECCTLSHIIKQEVARFQVRLC